MKIAVLGANGKAGKLIVSELVNRNHDVTAIVRGENKTDAQHVIQKDVFSLTKEDLKGFDKIVNALGFWAEEDLPKHVKMAELLTELLNGTDTQLYVVGGAGSLYVDKQNGVQLYTTPEFPKEYYSVASITAKSLEVLKKHNNIKWVFVSPAAVFDPTGEKTGNYEITDNSFKLNSNNESYVSYADYALGFADVLEEKVEHENHISIIQK